jgi:SAM-dependent methyltransferase
MPGERISFDRAADIYDETRGFPPGEESPSVALLATAGRLTQVSRILEIGIGTGRIALPLAPYVGALFGLDISAQMMGRLRGKPGGDQIRLVEGDAMHLPFPAHAFDAVVAVHVLHLVPDYIQVLKEAARTLRPGGTLLLGWNERAFRYRLEEVWRAVTAHTLPQGRGRWTWEKRGVFLVEEGWQMVGEEHVHCFVTYRAPQDYIDGLRQRSFSQTWQMTDEDLAAGIAAVEAYAKEHYGDLTQPVEVQASFHVQAYAPPELA